MVDRFSRVDKIVVGDRVTTRVVVERTKSDQYMILLFRVTHIRPKARRPKWRYAPSSTSGPVSWIEEVERARYEGRYLGRKITYLTKEEYLTWRETSEFFRR